MTGRWMASVGALLVLAGCPTEKEVTWVVDADAHTASIRLHDLRTHDDLDEDWLVAGSMLRGIEGDGVTSDGIVRYEQVGDALDVILDLELDDATIDRLLPRSDQARIVCLPDPVLETNGVDLTELIGARCVAFGPATHVYTWTTVGDATDDEPSLLAAWRAAGAPAQVAVEPPR